MRTPEEELSDADQKQFQATPHLVISAGSRQLWLASHRLPGEAFLKEDSALRRGRWIRFLGYDLRMFLGSDPTKVLSPPLKRLVKMVVRLEGEDTALKVSINDQLIAERQEDRGRFEFRIPVNRYLRAGDNTIDVQTRSTGRWGGVNMVLEDVTGAWDLKYPDGFDCNTQARRTFTLPAAVILAADQ